MEGPAQKTGRRLRTSATRVTCRFKRGANLEAWHKGPGNAGEKERKIAPDWHLAEEVPSTVYFIEGIHGSVTEFRILTNGVKPRYLQHYRHLPGFIKLTNTWAQIIYQTTYHTISLLKGNFIEPVSREALV